MLVVVPGNLASTHISHPCQAFTVSFLGGVGPSLISVPLRSRLGHTFRVEQRRQLKTK